MIELRHRAHGLQTSDKIRLEVLRTSKPAVGKLGTYETFHITVGDQQWPAKIFGNDRKKESQYRKLDKELLGMRINQEITKYIPDGIYYLIDFRLKLISVDGI